MNKPIESGSEWIEEPSDLGLKIDSLEFEDIEDIYSEFLENEKVYDLEVDKQHNYIVENLGIVHNGGGK
jgi:intein/homing endonuclease